MRKSKEHPKFGLKRLCLLACVFGLIFVVAFKSLIQMVYTGKSSGKMIQSVKPFHSTDGPPAPISLSTPQEDDSPDFQHQKGPYLDEGNGIGRAPYVSHQIDAYDGEDAEKVKISESPLPQKPDEDDTQILLEKENRAKTSVLNSTTEEGCDLFKGQWVEDPLGPLYAYNSCRVLSQPQNCQDNGRPDKQYEYFKWKPDGCEIPRLDPISFLELMRGKTMAFIGDSLARNQYESLLCILLQVEDAKSKGNRTMQRWYFQAYEFTLVRIWSSFLVHQTNEPFSFAPDDSIKLFLDELDNYSQYIPSFDVMIISSGHWWMRKSAYIVKGEIRGGYKWESNVTEIDQQRAFSMAFETALKLIGEIPNYNGLTILKPYSPDHYQRGQWDTGGSCTGKTQPYALGGEPRNAFNIMMRQKQLDSLEVASQRLQDSKKRNGSKYTMLDVFDALNYRADGHPGPYRNKDPNKRTQRDEKGRPPPQDCLHWCMPGPVDTVNQLLFELLKKQLPKQELK